MFFLRALRIVPAGSALLFAAGLFSAEAQEFCGSCPTGYGWMGPPFDAPEFCSKCDAGYAIGFYGDDYYCAACPPGYTIKPLGETFFCEPSGGGSGEAVRWAKPYWAKVDWQRASPGSPCPPGMFAWEEPTPPGGGAPKPEPAGTPSSAETPSNGSGAPSIKICFECSTDGTVIGEGGYDRGEYRHPFKGPTQICAGNPESGLDKDGKPYTIVTISQNGAPWDLNGQPWRVRSGNWKIEPPCNPASFFKSAREACFAGEVPISGAATFISRAGASDANTVRGDYICFDRGYVEIRSDALRWFSCSDSAFQTCNLTNTARIEKRDTRGNSETLVYNDGADSVVITRH